MDELIVLPARPITDRLASIEANMERIAAMLETLQPRTLPDLLTRQEAAKELRVSVKTVDNYAGRGLLTKVQTAAGVRSRREQVEKLKKSVI